MRTAILSSLLFLCGIVQAQYTITDGHGNTITSGTGKTIRGNRPVQTVTILSAAVENATPYRFSVVFSDDIDGVSPDVSEWTITINDTPYEADNYDIWYDQVNFYSGSVEASEGDVVTVTYSGDSWISYPDYYPVQNYTNYSVTNNISTSSYTILYQWDFETEDLGLWTDSEVEAYFDGIDTGLSAWYDNDSIVSTTINGQTTKALKINQIAGNKQQGFQHYGWFSNMQTNYDSVCMSYNIWWEPDFEAVSGNSKIPGLVIMDEVRSVLCSAGDFLLARNLYKGGFRDNSYFYTWLVKDGSCPWGDGQNGGTWEEFYLDSTYFIPGVWYDITICVTKNTITGGTANEDGLFEQWIYDDMIYQHDNIGWMERPDTAGIDAMSIAWFSSDPNTSKASYGLIDNITIWTPTGDSNWDNGTLHATNYKITSPTAIQDQYRVVYADTTFTLSTPSPHTDTLYSDNYPSAMTPGNNCAYLVDAGEGNTVTATIIDGYINSGDWIFFYNSNDPDGVMNARLEGADADLTNNFEGGAGVVTSTGRYLYVLNTNSEGASTSRFRIKVQITP